jgi:hypothetical protein
MKSFSFNHKAKPQTGRIQTHSEEVILDLILTDFHKFYNNPEVIAPLGSSDHNVVVSSPFLVHAGTNNVGNNKNIIRRYSRAALNTVPLVVGLAHMNGLR